MPGARLRLLSCHQPRVAAEISIYNLSSLLHHFILVRDEHFSEPNESCFKDNMERLESVALEGS